MRVLNVHVPRTGGTSIAGQLQVQMGERFLGDFKHDAVGGEFNSLKWPENYDTIMGHFRPETYTGADMMVTWLRHPVDLVPSLYQLWRNMIPIHPIQKALHEQKPELLTFAAWDAIQHWYTKTYFGGFDMKKFGFIGCFERREADLAKLAKLLAVKLDPAVRDNARKRPMEVTNGMKKDLAKLLADDIKFYKEHIRAT
jgi:hypothetical protein